MVGGLTEARRIAALASAYDIPTIPHGSSIYSYHLQISFPNCPMAEVLVMSPKVDKIVSYFGNLLRRTLAQGRLHGIALQQARVSA